MYTQCVKLVVVSIKDILCKKALMEIDHFIIMY